MVHQLLHGVLGAGSLALRRPVHLQESPESFQGRENDVRFLSPLHANLVRDELSSRPVSSGSPRRKRTRA